MGLGTAGVVLVFGALLVLVYLLSRGSLYLLMRSLPVADRRARVIAKDWGTIGAMPLSGWILLALAVGPDYPIVIGMTSTLIVALAPVILRSSLRNREPDGPRGTWKRYAMVSLVLVACSIALAYAVLWALSYVLVDN